jgi:Bacterial protein of unknown function (DUF899)
VTSSDTVTRDGEAAAGSTTTSGTPAPWWTELESTTLHVEGEAPGLWPTGASEEYRRARSELRRAEAELRDRIEAVAAMRRALPLGAVVQNHRFAEVPSDLATDGPEPRSRSWSSTT